MAKLVQLEPTTRQLDNIETHTLSTYFLNSGPKLSEFGFVYGYMKKKNKDKLSIEANIIDQ